MAIEQRRLQVETEAKAAEIEAKRQAEVHQFKRYGEALAQVLAPQTDEVTELPSYFRGVEDQFE